MEVEFQVGKVDGLSSWWFCISYKVEAIVNNTHCSNITIHLVFGLGPESNVVLDNCSLHMFKHLDLVCFHFCTLGIKFVCFHCPERCNSFTGFFQFSKHFYQCASLASNKLQLREIIINQPINQSINQSNFIHLSLVVHTTSLVK